MGTSFMRHSTVHGHIVVVVLRCIFMFSLALTAVNRVDLDPQGVQLAAVADPLKEATGLLTTLLQHSAHRLKVQELAFEV